MLVMAADPSSPGSTISRLVAVIVQTPIPTGIDHAKMISAMAQTIPLYRSVPGLLRKYYIISDDGEFGGVYLWESRSKAEAWYGDSVVWHADVSKRSGEQAQIEYFQVQFDVTGQGQSSSSATDRVVSVVKFPAVPGTDCFQFTADVVAASAPQVVPGLIRRYFNIADDGRLGGIYLWDSWNSAKAYHSDDWSARIVRIYGSPAEVTYCDAPIVLENSP